MIGLDSILRRLPPQLDRKQALFLDGIRHSVEILQFAYARLRLTLTDIALNYNSTPLKPEMFTIAFLDAWAVVDAIDRFRSLWALLPNGPRGPAPDGVQTFSQLSQPVRGLRNVADHLAERADYVIAKQGTALGELTWYTALNPQGTAGLSCVLLPGTFTPGERQLVNPAEMTFTYPTGLIHLAAGEHRACLSDLFPEIERLVRSVERALEETIIRAGLVGQQAGADIFLATHLVAAPETPPIVRNGEPNAPLN